ncbi:bifunctional lysylphosphatidylglycerol synthetase/lysine--tRNA ligase LysX [Corynebacterium lactis]|uniref:Lysine--tRNA ligase n=1 Tax=Corynebacterium lactis RW2-5 TaxID=1408189 RepID=A0A0K2GXB7_9CORY|nr:bifunctional lysylphosphatidylglycerol synthetase/lysine--tRNA ligase LysX [Corynebacterium lactis]ALA66425.1 lysyl-tRNA synthetase [Corynebacterium lactis RW2-5]
MKTGTRHEELKIRSWLKGGSPADRARHTFIGLFGWALSIYAVVCLIFSVLPPVRHLLAKVRFILDFLLYPMPETSIAWAVLLFLIAGGVFSRKRLAWWMVMALSALTLTSNLLALPSSLETARNLRDLNPDQILNPVDKAYAELFHLGWVVPLIVAGIIIQFIVIGMMFWAGPLFIARVRKSAGWRAAGVYAIGASIATSAGWTIVSMFPGTLRGGSLEGMDRLWWTMNAVVGFSVLPSTGFSGRPPGWVATLLGLFGALAVIAAAIALFKSASDRNSLTGDDETAIRAMLARWGDDDSLGYFATRRDKSVVYAPSGRAAITYRVHVGVMLASGDPVGDPEHWSGAIEEFLRRAYEFGWAPGVMGASQRGARAYRRHGLTEFHLGDEAVLDTSTYRISGPDRKSIRQAVHRARKAGVKVRIRRHNEVGEDEFKAIVRDVDRWRDTTDERGFSMALGRLGDPADSNNLLVEALVGQQRVAVLSFSPWGKTGYSLDLMRRGPKAPNGTVELMVTEVCQSGEDLGIARISLNFAMFRTVFASEDKLGVGPLQRNWRLLLVFLSKFWQMEALYRTNDRYGPTWVPRYACFATPRTLPRIAFASGIAEGFVNVPRFLGGDSRRRITGMADTSKGALAAYAAVPEILAGINQRPTRRVPEQTAVRIASATAMKESGRDPWPVGMQPSVRCADIAKLAGTSAASASGAGTGVSVAGRVMAKRDFGGVVFLQVRDFSGECQVLVERERTTEFDRISDLDLADLIYVEGAPGHSKRGEPSLLATSWQITAKSLHPLPDKVAGLRDPETRSRNRHVDLAVGEDSRRILRARSAILHSLRSSLVGEGFLEVETPILQQIHGGANARPFTTHINAYDTDLYLRIAPELYLKRLMCGGVDRVFELGRTFRNEGVDATHNPEFTILEAYAAYGDYTSMRKMCQKMIQDAAIAANGVCAVPGPDGEMVDISGDWPVKTLHQAVTEAIRAKDMDIEDLTGSTDVERLTELCDALEIPYRADWDAGQVSLEMYEHLVEDHTKEPTFYTDFPLSVSPLTRTHRTDGTVTERWDLVAWGVELGTAYTELTDPLDQRARLEEQSFLAAGGDPEAMEVDEEFLKALEFGMPPTGGLGMGVDRVVMLITGATIRESLPFPFVKVGR